MPARDDDPETFFELKVRPGAGRHVRQVPRGGQGQRRPAARLARGDAQGRRKRPGGRARRANKSLLIQAVEHADESLEMPPGKLLPTSVRADLAAWVAAGAKWPKIGDGGPDDRGAEALGLRAARSRLAAR